MDVGGVLREKITRKAAARLLYRHPALYAEFSGPPWRQRASDIMFGETRPAVNFHVMRPRPDGACSFDHLKERLEAVTGDAVGPCPEVLFRLEVAWCPVSRRSTVAFVVDHLAADGRGLYNLAADFVELYNSIVTGRAVGPAPSITVFDLAEHERQLTSSEFGARTLYDVSELLAGVSPYGFTRLPVRPEAGDRNSNATAIVPLTLGPDQRRQWQRRLSASTSDVVLISALLAMAVWASLGLDTLPIVSGYENRHSTESERVVGWVANTITVPLRVHPYASLSENVAAARRTWLRALENGWYPGLAVRRALASESDDTNRRPTVSVAHGAMQPWTAALGDVGPARIARRRTYPPTGGVGPRGRLHVDILSGADRVDVDLVFESGLFEEAFVQRTASNLRTLFDHGASLSDVPVSSLPQLVRR